jgi:hypothetical protein
MADQHDGGPALPRRSRIRRPLPARTSEVLHDLATAEGERVSFGEILLRLRHRAFGFTMLVFGLPCSLPMPPGIPTICGIALVLIAINLILGRRRIWLPKAIAAKTIARADLQRMVTRALPLLQRLERFCKPRVAMVTETAGKALIGVVVLALGVLLILPIPFIGNIPPGIATAVLAVGLAERDGAVVIAGLLLGLVAIGLAGAGAWAAILGIESLVDGQ